MALLAIGTTAFAIAGPPRWGVRSDGLDVLTIPYSGYISALAAFQSTLSKWEQSSIDGNMYLASWDNNDGKRYNTIELRYVGAKGGNLPDGKEHSDFSVQSASFSNSDGTLTIDIMALCPTKSYEWISTSSLGGGSAPSPSGTPQVIFSKVRRSIEYTGSYPTSLQGALNWFVQVTVSESNSSETVPGRYWQNSNTKSITLHSIGS